MVLYEKGFQKSALHGWTLQASCLFSPPQLPLIYTWPIIVDPCPCLCSLLKCRLMGPSHFFKKKKSKKTWYLFCVWQLFPPHPLTQVQKEPGLRKCTECKSFLLQSMEALCVCVRAVPIKGEFGCFAHEYASVLEGRYSWSPMCIPI